MKSPVGSIYRGSASAGETAPLLAQSSSKVPTSLAASSHGTFSNASRQIDSTASRASSDSDLEDGQAAHEDLAAANDGCPSSPEKPAVNMVALMLALAIGVG